MLVHLYRVAIKFTSINGPMILYCPLAVRELTPLVQMAGLSVWSTCSVGLWFHCLERGGCMYSTLWGLLVE